VAIESAAIASMLRAVEVFTSGAAAEDRPWSDSITTGIRRPIVELHRIDDERAVVATDDHHLA
jgi:hypothetical protein